MRTRLFILTLLALCLSAAPSQGQEPGGAAVLQRQRAAQELEGVLNNAQLLSDKTAYVGLRSRAAGLLWPQDRERAGAVFVETWAWIDKQDERGFSKEEARAVLLGHLFTRDHALARQLLETLSAGAGEGAAGLKQLNRLAADLIEQDPAQAAALLERSVLAKPSPEALPLLAKLREKEAGRADLIAARLMEAVRSQPPGAALPTIYALNFYVFPGRASSPAAPPPADALRRHYFASAYEVLTRAVREGGPPPRGAAAGKETPGSFFQSQIAELLAALAPHFAPDRAPELRVLASQLSGGMSPGSAQVARAMLRRVETRAAAAGPDYTQAEQGVDPAGEVFAAATRGDFDEARQLAAGLENRTTRASLGRMIVAAEFRRHLAKGDAAEALRVAQNAEDAEGRLLMLAQVTAALLKGSSDLASAPVLTSARASLKGADCTRAKAAALLSLAADSASGWAAEGSDWLRDAAVCLNSLERAGSKQGTKTESGAVRPDLRRAFSAVGQADLDTALLVANTLEEPAARLTAKLSACEKWLGPAVEPQPRPVARPEKHERRR